MSQQDGDPNSMLCLYRTLLGLRRAEPALAVGDIQDVVAHGPVLSYRRAIENDLFTIVANTSGHPIQRDIEGGTVVAGTHPIRNPQLPPGPLTLLPDQALVIQKR